MTSLLAAAEEGNVDAINELMESSSHFDVNLANRVRLSITSLIFVNENENEYLLNYRFKKEFSNENNTVCLVF